MQDIMSELQDVAGKFKCKELLEFWDFENTKRAKRFWKALRNHGVIQKSGHEFVVAEKASKQSLVIETVAVAQVA